MRKQLQGIIFIAPALLFLLIFIIFPIFYSAHLSFYRVELTGRTWIGLQNYKTILGPGPFWDAIRTSSKYLCAFLFLNLILSYLIALGLYRWGPKVVTIFQSCYYIPVVLSPIVTVSAWRWFYRYEEGGLNRILGVFSLSPIMWLGLPSTAIWAISLMIFASVFGAGVLLYSATLGQLNTELLDAARIDGANELQVIWHIITPLTQPMRLYLVIMSVLGAVQTWERIYFFTGGGPIGSTRSITFEIFHTAFNVKKFGLASSMTTVATVVTLAFTWIVMRKLRLQVD